MLSATLKPHWAAPPTPAIQISAHPMSWLLQSRRAEDMASLIRWADGHSGQGSYPVLIREEHAKQLPGKCDVHFLLTAMQLGDARPPRAVFGSMLPDIG